MSQSRNSRRLRIHPCSPADNCSNNTHVCLDCASFLSCATFNLDHAMIINTNRVWKALWIWFGEIPWMSLDWFHRDDYFCGRLCTIKLSTNAMKNGSQSHPCNPLVTDKKPSNAYPQILAINDPYHQHHHCCHQSSTGFIMMAISVHRFHIPLQAAAFWCPLKSNQGWKISFQKLTFPWQMIGILGQTWNWTV